MSMRYPRIGAFPSSSPPLIFFDPTNFLSVEVFSLLSQIDSQNWEDWMKWETESSGVQGSRGMS